MRTSVVTQLKAPFPYFGGKSRVAPLVWEALGDVDNYIEPFAGSLAVLLSRPHVPKVETVNDIDAMLANFWRAVAADPDAVAHHADWPVNEVDLEARHLWLVRRKPEIRELLGNPDAYDAKAAGWWVWGISAWIGSGWCDGAGPWSHDGEAWVKGNGVGITRQLPRLGSSGTGVHRAASNVHEIIAAVGARMRRVRVACGDWSRICSPAVTVCIGMTGVFLDPPYGVTDRDSVYNEESFDVAKDVGAWALQNGDNPLLRIVLAGYAGEHDALEAAGWLCVEWKARGGYGVQGNGRGRKNAARERLWFSPHCLKPEQTLLFESNVVAA